MHRALVLSAACSLVVGCSEDPGAERGSGADAGSSPNARCVDVSHVGALQKKDLRVIGSGFEAYEGLTLRILATLGEPAYGLGEALLEGGSFDIFLPGALGDYTGIAVHVDRVRDNACNPDREFIWQQTTGPLSALGPGFSISDSGEAIWAVTPDTLRVFEQIGPCNLNGIFDLTVPLACPAEK
jgi:hypothetical protein